MNKAQIIIEVNENDVEKAFSEVCSTLEYLDIEYDATIEE